MRIFGTGPFDNGAAIAWLVDLETQGETDATLDAIAVAIRIGLDIERDEVDDATAIAACALVSDPELLRPALGDAFDAMCVRLDDLRRDAAEVVAKIARRGALRDRMRTRLELTTWKEKMDALAARLG